MASFVPPPRAAAEARGLTCAAARVTENPMVGSLRSRRSTAQCCPTASETDHAMNKLHPAARERILRRVQLGWQLQDGEYLDFLDDARQLLPDKCTEPRFAFVIRSIWFACSGEIPLDFASKLRARYDRFVQEFDWGALPSDECERTRIELTLSVWQRHWPLPLTVGKATEMRRSVHRLVATSGGAR